MPDIRLTEDLADFARPGSNVIDLSIGNLSLDPHSPVKVQPSGAYSPAAGLISLRELIAEHEAVPVDRVLVTTGGTGALLVALAACDRRRIVWLPRPYFPPYVTMARTLGYRVQFYDVDRPPADVLDELATRIGGSAAAVLWNFPHNPTGVTDDGLPVRRLEEVCARYETLLIGDRVYEELSLDRRAGRLPRPDWELRVKSLSKSLGLAGERIGYLLAEPDVCRRLAKLHWHMLSAPPMASQRIAEAVMQGATARWVGLRTELRARRDLVSSRLQAYSEVSFQDPAAGMFAWFRVRARSSEVVARARRSGLIIMSGQDFGLADEAGFVRINFGVDDSTLLAALDRLDLVLGEILADG